MHYENYSFLIDAGVGLTQELVEWFHDGVRLRELKPTDLAPDFQSKILALCESDPNIRAVWLYWLDWPACPSALLASIICEDNERRIGGFIERTVALGGPRFVGFVPEEQPGVAPFYRRPSRDVYRFGQPGTTFPVADFPLSEGRNPAVSLKGLMKSRCNVTCEAVGANASHFVDSSGHPLVAAAHLAYAGHHPLALSPDDVWLCLAQGFARHLQLHAKRFQDQVVAHTGKVTLKVIRDEFVKGSPANDWPSCFAEFSDAIAEHAGASRDLIVANFSTTGPIERAASEVVLMSALQHYFDYRVHTRCGIPAITILGTADDWRTIRRRVSEFARFELNDWVAVIERVLDEFVAVVEGATPRREFWNKLYKRDDSSGGPNINGWINCLFPYILHRYEGTHVVNAYATKWCEVDEVGRQRLADCGPHLHQFSTGLSRAPFSWIYQVSASPIHLNHAYPMEFLAGFVAVSQDPTSGAVRPVIGWGVADRTPDPLNSTGADARRDAPASD